MMDVQTRGNQTPPLIARIPETQPLLSPTRVIVVEDDAAFQPLWGHILWCVSPQIDMIWCEDMEAATLELEDLERRADPVKLVISDILLPRRHTGLELMRKMRTKMKSPPPFVMVSSLTQENYFKLMRLECGAPPYLEKPLEITECVPMIKQVLVNQTHGNRM